MWVPGWNGIVVDGTVLTFTILLTVFVGLAFGVSVALHAGHTDVNFVLKETERGTDHQDKCDRDLRHHQRAAQPTIAAADRTALCFLKHKIHIGVTGVERNRNAKGQTDEHSERSEERRVGKE